MLEHLGAGQGVRFREAEQIPGHVGVPGVDEALDLPAGEGEQLALGEAVQLPVLALIGIGAAGDEEPAVPVDARELLDGLLDLLAALQGVGHLVQPVQQDQPALAHQLGLQVHGMALQHLGQLLDDELPQGVGADGSAGRGKIGGEIAQQHPHRQQPLVRPALGLWPLVPALVRVRRDGGAQQLQVGRPMAQQLAGHAQRDEIQEGGLAAARSAHQDQVLFLVQRIEGGLPIDLPVGHGALGVARRLRVHLARVAALGQQCGVDGRELCRPSAVAGEQRQLVRPQAEPGQVALAQVARAGPRLARLIDDGLVDVAGAGADGRLVVVLHDHRTLAGGLGRFALRDGAAAAHLGLGGGAWLLRRWRC